MKITVTGSLGNIGKNLIPILTGAGHDVTAISSNIERKADIEALGAKAAIGSVSNSNFLTTAFSGADAIFAMTPPNLGGSHIIENTTNAGKAFAAAIIASGVKKVVMLSSIGADVPSGTGPIEGLYHIEQIYSQLEGVSVTFLRAGYFYTNYYNDVPLIKNAGIIGSNFSDTISIPLVHPVDIATAAAEELQRPAAGNQVRYIVSDYRPAADVASTIGAAIGKPELPWVAFTDVEALQGMTQAGVPEEIAGLYVAMGSGLRNGTIQEDFVQTAAPVTGVIKLEDFAKEYATAF
ncbi:NAD(P)H-binding protein [Niabella yanshanensis]|uniref:NAD(P)H-binding protein n=1 Tax=Niabella yanshanensis TaxID=577386 RepID=A0ABZ0W4I6_9BACT|nr:NmrA family NAD(P)-binding protein [Niabella yanshanensis]WQD38165.1 NAD(P)H-binding protein [Niabella yanshanensis]